MIRKLEEKDRESVLAFLYDEPEVNLYLIGDIYNSGFDNEHQQLYGEFRDGAYHAVMGRNRSQITYYAKSTDFNKEWIDIFNRFDFLFLAAKEKLIQPIKPFYPDMKEDKMDFMKSTTFSPDTDIDYSEIKILKTEDEAKKVYDLLATIEELYTVHKKTEEEYIKYLLDNSGENGTTVYIERNNEVIACASAVFESKKSAMIVNVATHNEHRKKGLGKKVFHFLVDLYVNHKKKTLCLYYDDPRAEQLYKNMGFVDMERWSMLAPDD